MPSGTLANQLALRALAGAKRRVIVPETSHIYNDTGDACQTLSALTLLPLGAGRGHLHARRRRGGAGAHRQRPRRHRRRRDRHREPGAPAVGPDVRLGRAGPASRRWPASAASASTSTARGCSSPRPTPAAARPSTRRRSTPSTCRCGSTSTAARARSSPARAACSTACSTPAGCSAATWPSAGRRRWSPATTWTGSWSGCERPSRCPRRSIAPSRAHPRVAVERIPNGTNLTRLTLKGVDPAQVVAPAGRARRADAGAVQRRGGHAGRQRDVDAHDGARARDGVRARARAEQMASLDLVIA